MKTLPGYLSRLQNADQAIAHCSLALDGNSNVFPPGINFFADFTNPDQQQNERRPALAGGFSFDPRWRQIDCKFDGPLQQNAMNIF
jgi:hypothetical protein